MNFKLEFVASRERRALVVMAVALVTVVAASITYLRPPANPLSAPVVARAAPSVGQYDPIAFTVVPGTGRPTGAYFVWHVGVAEAGGWGGHRAG